MIICMRSLLVVPFILGYCVGATSLAYSAYCDCNKMCEVAVTVREVAVTVGDLTFQAI